MNMILRPQFFYLTVLIYASQALELISAETPVPHPECPAIDDVNNPKLLPYPGECTKYYSCLNGLAYAQKCPGTFHWSRLAYRCDYPEKAMCPWQTAAIPLPLTPPTAPTAAPTTPMQSVAEIVYQFYPNDCNRYYQCQAMSCPNNYHWNFQKQQCDFPHLAQCPFRPSTLPPLPEIPTAATAPPTTTPQTPIVPGSSQPCIECTSWCMGQGHIYLPYPGDCRKFVQCNGLAFVHNCPDDLLWNDKLKTCDRFCVTN